ncbi:uncharacterized protein LOC142635316 [Castanea sativa]|uniref:uncharacterized protein LOC142635316 n=1 Tax=Castanea sativa TaxID=21020 RepID=UPI003F650A5E
MAWGSPITDPDTIDIKEIQKQLDRLNEAEFTEASKVEFLSLSKRMDELLQKQEIYWAQRSKINWLKHGDKNTKFFHAKATQRRSINYIKGIQNTQGQWVEELDEVVEVASAYFDKLFHLGVGDQMEECLNAVQSMVTDDMWEFLSTEFMAEEVKMALFQMGPTKALGLDGRLITGNVLVAYETLHTMLSRKKGKKGSLALKLDISKAYDQVKWQSLQSIMEKMVFPANWIERVMSCVTTPSFSILVNGKPYESEGRIKGVSICNGAPKVINLMFVDDSLLFCQATWAKGETIVEILQTYARASRQSINLEKSSAYFSSNTLDRQKGHILEILGVNEVNRFETYLGLPTLIGRTKYHTFSFLKDRIWKKLQG